MTPRSKQTLRNYIEAIGGIKSIYVHDRTKYIKALITFLNSCELSGIYDKMEKFYNYIISNKPMKFVK